MVVDVYPPARLAAGAITAVGPLFDFVDSEEVVGIRPAMSMAHVRLDVASEGLVDMRLGAVRTMLMCLFLQAVAARNGMHV